MRGPLTKALLLQRLTRKCRQWGGDLQHREGEFFDRWNDSNEVYEDRLFSSAPFTGWDLGVLHRDRRIVYGSHAEPEQLSIYATSLIHEIAHCFASIVPPNQMIAKDDDSNEFRFFGWELLLAKQVGLTVRDFYAGNHDYSIEGTGETVGDLIKSIAGKRRLRDCMLKRIVRGNELGIIRDGQPVSIRSAGEGLITPEIRPSPVF